MRSVTALALPLLLLAQPLAAQFIQGQVLAAGTAAPYATCASLS
jgi:hypothetical protein